MISNSSTSALLDFISDYTLGGEGLIVFESNITFNKNGTLQKIRSQVQIITLPHEMAVYINEFFKEEYNEPEMYSTTTSVFNYTRGGFLEITGPGASFQNLVIEPVKD